MSAIALRPDLDMTIGDLRAELSGAASGTVERDVSIDRIALHPEAADPVIALGSDEVPLTSTSLGVLAEYTQVPTAFFDRLGQGGLRRQADLLTALLEDSPRDKIVRVESSGSTLLSVRDPGAERVRPVQLVEMAARVLGSDESPVQRLVRSSAFFGFDVHVPIDSGYGVGGDLGAEVEAPEALTGYSWVTKRQITSLSQVGDITAAGLRIGLDIKRGLAPTVQPWMMRLACTNGMETHTQMTKIDGRGLTAEQVLEDLEAKARVAFASLDEQIEHLYDLRNQSLATPERRLHRLAREQGIPDRSVNLLMDMLPTVENPTEFDLVNMITNLPNHSVVRSEGARLALERVGGTVVSDHSARCGQCSSILV